MHYKAWTTGASVPKAGSTRLPGRRELPAARAGTRGGRAHHGGIGRGAQGVPRLQGAAEAVAPRAPDQEGDYIFIRILNKSPRPPVSQAPAFMVIGDELPTMPGQVQVVLGPDPKLIFICSCVYNFAHSLPFLFHH